MRSYSGPSIFHACLSRRPADQHHCFRQRSEDYQPERYLRHSNAAGVLSGPIGQDGARFGFQNYDGENKRLRNEKGVNIIVKAIRHHHPGGAYSYRFEVDGKSLVISTDIEHVNGIDQNIVAFCDSADVLIHDAQYPDDELKEKQGWGHSSFSQAIQIARSAHIDRLVVTHNDPDHDDLFYPKWRVSGGSGSTASCSRGREW